ncbi:MAG: DUF5103 domain-containing protein [Bacteroidaceae bacterium]|nr:DUF5103 domain-containing protein [Bacteroidaceae bacterium]
MLRSVVISLALFVVLAVNAQSSRSFLPSVRSAQVLLNGEWGTLPVMRLGGDDMLHFSFDELSHIYHRYTYRVVHCNADWSPSDLLEIDYIEGFNDVLIEEWENSVNTNQLYTHYAFTIPNENMSLKLSGNYRVEVFDDEAEEDVPVASFDFSVVEPLVSFEAGVSGDTDISFNERHQQVSFAVHYPSFVSSPSAELKAVVYQNGRRDNVVRDILPTYITNGVVEYVNNEKLIFDAGNEYRRFEITDPNSPGEGVEEVVYAGGLYNVILYMDKPRVSHSNYRDENGRFLVNTFEGFGTQIEADYVNVHFALDVPRIADGELYLLGDFCGNGFTPANKLSYDDEDGYYFTSQLLKMGVYNYRYLWLSSVNGKVLDAPADGNFYETENEYSIYIYYRGIGDRADRLLGVHSVVYGAR